MGTHARDQVQNKCILCGDGWSVARSSFIMQSVRGRLQSVHRRCLEELKASPRWKTWQAANRVTVL